ncbi:MAG: mannose-1-phosphate guanylyltransferase [Deltaproteobacteria bacterium HGW-Deltaproteobacteria-6]|nr:MAG: mannose-1-phosphate guanylyltransferase [Deltaproteobacteria bacterium HGW-Deltaproteobacteria-6]
MRALLLAAGLGTRLRPLTNDIPKCLIAIDGKPLLYYWMTMLYESGVYPMLVNLYHHADKVAHFIDQSPLKKYVATIHEDKLLGTGGTLLKNREFFGNEAMMLVHADNLSVFDVRAFIDSHQNRPAGCEITMMTFKTPTPQSCGIIETDHQGCVQAFYEKVANPPGDRANGAVYIIEPSLFTYLEGLKKEFIDFSTEVIPHYIGRINTFHNDIYHRDIGTIESYEAACREYPAVSNQYKNQLAENTGI